MSPFKCPDILRPIVAFVFAPRALPTILLIGAACMCVPSRADELSDCMQASDMPRVIAGCTGLLAAPEPPALYLALVYRNRSAAYAAMGDFERAGQDRQRALALNPDYQKTARDHDPADQADAVKLKLSGSNGSVRDEADLPERR